MSAEHDPRYPIGPWTRPASVSDAELDDLVRRIETLPSRMRDVAAQLTPELLGTRYREGGWTLRQVVHHVPESHMNGFIRFKWALTEANPSIKTYEEALWAETPELEDLPIGTSLDLLEAIQSKWVILIRSLGPERLRSTTFRHPEWGTTDLATMVSLYAWHGDHHLAHITSTLAQSRQS